MKFDSQVLEPLLSSARERLPDRDACYAGFRARAASLESIGERVGALASSARGKLSRFFGWARHAATAAVAEARGAWEAFAAVFFACPKYGKMS